MMVQSMMQKLSICQYSLLEGCIASRGLQLSERSGFATSLRRPHQKLFQHALVRTCRAASATIQVQETSTSEAVTPPAANNAAAPSFKAHIDWKHIVSNLDEVKKNVAQRNSSADPELVVELYSRWRSLQDEVETLRSQRNENTKAMKGKVEPEQRARLVEEGKRLKDRIALLETELDDVEGSLQREGQRLPNVSHPEVPVGGEEAAREVKVVGQPRRFDFPVLDHVALGEALDLLDFEAGAVSSGTKFVYLRRAAALLEMGLCNWALQKVASRGYLPMSTPDLVRASVLEKCGFQPRAENTQVYSVEDSPLCLTGTAEVPLAAVHMDRIIPEAELPIRMSAFGHCFRTEAGAAGSASRGLYRIHQFSKVEMFVICTPAQSEALLEELCGIEEEIYTELGLHFKILDMPTGDLGAPAYRKLDIEAWMPGLGRYGEISSASNCTDYQSRRLNIRYRPGGWEEEDSSDTGSNSSGKSGKKSSKKQPPTEFVHTLNATACAVPRLIVAILENFQQADGTVVVPPVLRPYIGGLDVIRPPP